MSPSPLVTLDDLRARLEHAQRTLSAILEAVRSLQALGGRTSPRAAPTPPAEPATATAAPVATAAAAPNDVAIALRMYRPCPACGGAVVADGAKRRHRHERTCSTLATPSPAPAAPPAPVDPPAAAPVPDGVIPDAVKPCARDAYLEGREARKAGKARDVNPHDGLRGIPVARRRAWDLGWEGAA